MLRRQEIPRHAMEGDVPPKTFDEEYWLRCRNANRKYLKDMKAHRKTVMSRASKAIGGHPEMAPSESPPRKRPRRSTVLRRPCGTPTWPREERRARIRALIKKKEELRADKTELREALWLDSEEGRQWLIEMESLNHEEECFDASSNLR